MAVFVLILLVLFLIFICILHGDCKKTRDEITSKLNSIEGFELNQSYINEWGTFGIGIDSSETKICTIDAEIVSEAGEFDVKVFPVHEILQSEVMDGNTVITRTSRTSQLKGAVVGGVIFGPVGALVGGLSGKQISEKKITEFPYLRLSVLDAKKPFIEIHFTSNQIDRQMRYKEVLKKSEQWHAIFSRLIKKSEIEYSINESLIETGNHLKTSLLEKINKLAYLHENGELSDQEFERLKNMVLE